VNFVKAKTKAFMQLVAVVKPNTQSINKHIHWSVNSKAPATRLIANNVN